MRLLSWHSNVRTKRARLRCSKVLGVQHKALAPCFQPASFGQLGARSLELHLSRLGAAEELQEGRTKRVLADCGPLTIAGDRSSGGSSGGGRGGSGRAAISPISNACASPRQSPGCRGSRAAPAAGCCSSRACAGWVGGQLPMMITSGVGRCTVHGGTPAAAARPQQRAASSALLRAACLP